MEIPEYIDELKDLHYILLEYLKNDDVLKEDYQIIINFIETRGILENKEESKEFLQLLSIISRNHHRYPNFNSKIDQIFNHFKSEIKKSLTDSELFKIFKKSKRVLLYLFENQMITDEEFITNLFHNKYESNDQDFLYFFYPEIKAVVENTISTKIKENMIKRDADIFTGFEKKRQIGENDSYICQLIRDDSVEQFISHATKINLKLTSKIKPSIFETNSFLIKKNPTLIEYASFFGSIQIFKYLFLNKVDLTPSLWLYAIHGQNPDIIHLLEDNHIQPEDKTYEKCLKQAIKFHHNDISNYILNNLIDENVINYNLEHKFNENIHAYCFHYYNYFYFPNDLNDRFTFFYLCIYNYYTLVNLLINSQDFNINQSLIPKYFTFS